MKTVDLLESLEDRGYPSDYLFSRIRGKRSRLITDWEYIISLPDPLGYCASALKRPIVIDNDQIWHGLLKEYQWVYRVMNGDMRAIFRFFFTYAELRTLFIALRRLKGGHRSRIGDLFSLSVLSDRVKKILLSARDVASAAAALSKIFSSLTERLADLNKILLKQGLQGMEQYVTEGYLEYAAETAPHPVLKDFFSRLVDARNTLSLYKYIKLNAKRPPAFVRGGSITEKRFLAIRDSRNLFAIAAIVRTVTGTAMGTPVAGELENALYRNITGRLRKAGRDTLGIGLVLDYLWRCSIEARNLSTLFYGSDLDRDSLSLEILK